MATHPLLAYVNWMLLRLDMQSDGSPHFLRVLQERPMYHSTSSPRASRSRCEELSGPRRGTSEMGHPQVHEIPWQIGKCEKSGHSEDLGRSQRGRRSRTTSRPPDCSG